MSQLSYVCDSPIGNHVIWFSRCFVSEKTAVDPNPTLESIRKSFIIAPVSRLSVYSDTYARLISKLLKNWSHPMGKLLEELKRRKVFRVATVYAIVAWVLIQVADTVLPALIKETKTAENVVINSRLYDQIKKVIRKLEYFIQK